MVDTTPLACAVKGDKRVLSQTVLAEISKLNGARPLAFTVQLVSAWAVIIGAVAWAVHVNAIWATIPRGLHRRDPS